MIAPWASSAFERFGELLVKELGSRGFERIDAPEGASNPFPNERHGGWEWAFCPDLRRPKPVLLTRYLMLRLTFPTGPERDEQAKAQMTVALSIGADKEERFVRREVGQTVMTEGQLRKWTDEFWQLLQSAMASVWNLTEEDLSEEYIRRPSGR